MVNNFVKRITETSCNCPRNLTDCPQQEYCQLLYQKVVEEGNTSNLSKLARVTISRSRVLQFLWFRKQSHHLQPGFPFDTNALDSCVTNAVGYTSNT